MRRVVQVAVVVCLLLALGAGVAYAANIQCLGNLCEGTSQDDTIIGTSKPDQIYGRGGDDVIEGRAHTDTLLGNVGNDELYGEAGQDALRGSSGDDLLVGGPDETKGPRLTDEYFCGAGFDTVVLERSEGAVHNIAPNCEEIIRNP